MEQSNQKLEEKFYTKEEAIVNFRLDRRKKWFVYCGNICYNHEYTAPCLYCNGEGCHECGFQGKLRSSCPIPAFDPATGNTINVEGENFS